MSEAPAIEVSAGKWTGSQRSERRQFLQDNLLATISTLIAGLLGFGLQAMASHDLRPANYGKVFAVLGFFTLVTRPSAAFGRLQAWHTSRELSTDGAGDKSGVLLRSQTIRLMLIGSLAAFLCVLFGAKIGEYLHVPLSDIAVGAISIPFLLAVQPLLGSLQGEQRFILWSVLSILVNLSRLVLIVAFIFPMHAFGALFGNTLASIGTFLACLVAVWRNITVPSSPERRFVWGPALPFVVTGLAATLALGVFQGADVILVEHFFAKVPAGQYAAVAAVASAVFFASGGVASAVFPMVAARHAQGRSTVSVMAAAFGLCALAGLIGTCVLQVFGRVVLLDFAGKKYVPGAHYLGWYSLSMAVLAWVLVLVNTQQSLNKLSLLWVLIPAIILRPVLIILFHQTLLTVVVVSDLTVSLFALALTILYLASERARLRAWSGEPIRPLAYFGSQGATGARSDDLGDTAPELEPSGLGGHAHGPTEWLLARPWAVAIILAAIGLVVRHAWLAPGPLSSGDWKWPTRGRILEWFPWPSVWNNTLGLSGENRFLDAFRFPVYAINGLIAALGGSWTVIEKVVYFVPFAVLLPVAGWLLAREILGNTRWAWLAPILLLGNTYFLVEANGEIPLVMAEAIGCVALVAFLRAMRRPSMTWAVVAGLLVGASAAMDLRPAFLTGLLMIGYLLVLAFSEPGWALLRRRIWLSGASALTFIGTQMFWVLPLVMYKGHPAFPTPRTPDFNIITLEHGLAGVAASWSGGTPAPFAQAPLNPMYMVLPLLAMLPLTWRRMRAELLWLALAALVCAFLAKTNNPPFGDVYDWIYIHVPGFNLFREGSKFLYPIAIAYAVLIPAAFASLVDVARRLRSRAGLIKAVAGVALVLVLAVVGSSVLVLERGQLGSTTATAPEPPVFKQVTALLHADHHPGSVLWFGAPVYVTGNQYQDDHTYTITSATHPLDNLTGSVLSTVVQSRDVFQYFCPVITQSYCYVNRSVFPYLVGMVGASYVVSPASPDVGLLPSGITRAWLRQQLTAMFGPPLALGDAHTQFLVWHLQNPQPMIANYPAVALVQSGPWSLGSVLPALQALGVPAAYRQSFDVSDYPAARANLPNSIPVYPRTGGACPGSAGGSVGVMALTSTQSLQVVAGSTQATLPLLARSSRLPGWGVYGPLSVRAGAAISSSVPGVTLGPCLTWSALAASTFGVHTQPAGATRSSANGEQLRASLSGISGPWTELRLTYDPGWRLEQRPPQAVADGLFNLYHPSHPVTTTRGFTFTFSTLKWEHRGLIISILAFLVAALAIWLLALRERKRPRPARREVFVESRIGAAIGGLGELLLVLCGLAVLLAWFGVPSRFPMIAITGDPYNLDIVFGTVALGLFALSLFVRLGDHFVHSLRLRVRKSVPATHPIRRKQLAAVGGLSAAIALLASSCGVGGGHSANQAFVSAQQAGATSRLVVGYTLQQAQIQGQANDAPKCIADYTTALKAYPRLASAYYGRAQCYQSGGLDYPAAIHDYDRALTLSPGNPEYLLGRATADQGIGSLGTAAHDYQAASSAPAATPAQSLAAIDGLLNMDDASIAANVLQVAASRFPGDGLIRLGAADVAATNGNNSQAAALMAQAAILARSSTNPVELVSVLGRMCGFQLTSVQYQQALVTCQQAAQQAAATGQDSSGAYDNLGAVQAGMGDLSTAIADLTSAIGAFQGNVGPDAQPAGVDGFGLAYLYEARGRLKVEAHQTQGAIGDYRRALASLPSGLPDFAARLRSDVAAARHD